MKGAVYQDRKFAELCEHVRALEAERDAAEVRAREAEERVAALESLCDAFQGLVNTLETSCDRLRAEIATVRRAAYEDAAQRCEGRANLTGSELAKIALRELAARFRTLATPTQSATPCE